MTVPKFKKINIESYKPGKSKLYRLKNITKLSANESALGVSNLVKKEIGDKLGQKYDFKTHKDVVRFFGDLGFLFFCWQDIYFRKTYLQFFSV